MSDIKDTKPQEIKDKNKLYIGIFSVIVIAAIVIIAVANGLGTSKNSDEKSSTAKAVSVISEDGDQSATLDANIKNLRDVKFSKSHKAINKYEKKQSDTEEGAYSSSADGYGYLTYGFTSDSTPEYFGTKVSTTDTNALLQYVFYDDKLIEMRLQYGNIGETAYNNILSNISSTYGNATYSRTYSNGNKESWFKTTDSTLYVYYQSTGVGVYLRKN